MTRRDTTNVHHNNFLQRKNRIKYVTEG